MKDKIFGVLQRVGKSFMLPIAVLPVAGLLLGLGSTFTNTTTLETYGLLKLMGPGTILYCILTVLNQCGSVIFDNLPLIFAVGVAIGMAKKEKEVAALSAAIAFLVMHSAISAMIEINGGTEQLMNGATTSVLGITSMQMGAFGGIIVGLGVAALHNKFYNIELPQALSFFGGTRFVPIVSSVVYVAVGIAMYFIWQPVQSGIYALGNLVMSSGYVGTFFYGWIKRMLIPFGLHHVFYLPFWQTAVGGTMDVNGVMVEGAQNIFFAQLAAPNTVHFSADATRFFTGEFIVMIFGLPGAALAMYKAARKEKKKEVGGLLLSSALTSMLTGITEPLEFSFLFVAPVLFFVHSVLTGLAYMIAHILNITVGLTFSGGFLDLFMFGILQGNSKTGWLMIIPIGLIYFAVYYVVFTFLIRKLNLKTPGREADDEETKLYTRADYNAKKNGESVSNINGAPLSAEDAVSYEIVRGLGGRENISDVDCCATRLRVTIHDMARVNEGILKSTKAAGVVKKGNGVQVIYGPKVNIIKSNLEDFLAKLEAGVVQLEDGAEKVEQTEGTAVAEEKKVAEAATAIETKAVKKVVSSFILKSPMTGNADSITTAPDEAFAGKMMGDGAAVEPIEGMVVAPCDGTIGMIFDTKHAIGIVAENGMELLIHVGIDTVKLDGKGFNVLVAEGDTVTAGTPLLELDLDYLKENAPSVVSPVIVTDLAENQQIHMLASGRVAAGQPLLAVETVEE